MRNNVNSFMIAAALAAASLCPLSQSAAASAAQLRAPMMAKTSGTCVVEISTVAFTPLEVYDGSGGNILFNGTEASEAKCDHEAIQQWNNALNTGWSPTNRCAIISQTGPNDEIFTEITYVWNNGPSVRSDGYAIMCNHSANVSGVPPY